MSAQSVLRASFFHLPFEIRLSIYDRYCDLLRQDSRQECEVSSSGQQVCRRRSHADILHIGEFQYTRDHSREHHATVPGASLAYNAFVDMKLVSRQVRAEFVPSWLRRWVFEIPRPAEANDANRLSIEGDPDDFEQLKAFRGIAADQIRHVRRLRLTRHLTARTAPERAVEAETGDHLAEMLNQCGGEYHEKTVVHVQVRCRESSKSNRRASKDVLFHRSGARWRCFCDGSTTVSFRRDWG